ncbi:hypothetical protein V6N13_071573 [Hibiscus sabdariffa]
MRSSCTPSHQHESSTSNHIHSISKESVVALDPVKHQSVQQQSTDHPRIPVEAISVGRSKYLEKEKHFGLHQQPFRHIVEPWILLGDFNATVSAEEHQGCSSSPDQDFINNIFDFELHDLGYQGPDFTWYRSNYAVWLDCYLCNVYWLDVFTDSLVHHLLRMKSDHRPIFVTIGHIPSRTHQCRSLYFARWLQHENFKELVCSNWDTSLPFSATIENFYSAADTWNHTIFGSLSHRKQHIMARLQGVQRSLDQKHNAFISWLEISLQLELEQILDQ